MIRWITRSVISLVALTLLCAGFFEPLGAAASDGFVLGKGTAVTPYAATYSFSVSPGSTYTKSGTANPLICVAPCDYDTYHMTVTQQSKVDLNVNLTLYILELLIGTLSIL